MICYFSPIDGVLASRRSLFHYNTPFSSCLCATQIRSVLLIERMNGFEPASICWGGKRRARASANKLVYRGELLPANSETTTNFA